MRLTCGWRTLDDVDMDQIFCSALDNECKTRECIDVFIIDEVKVTVP